MKRFFLSILCMGFVLPVALQASWYYRFTETAIKESYFNADGMLTIDAYAGNITVIADQTDKIIIETTKRAVTKKALENMESYINIRDQHAQVVSRFKQDSWFNGSVTGYIDYVIRIPKAAHLPRINAGSGSIYINGVSGLINIEAGNGSVTLRNVVGGITVKTTSGSISIYCAQEAQGIIDAKSNAGIITIEGTCNSVRASTIAGSITVKQKELPETSGITLESSIGSISLTLPQRANARLQADTKMGSFYSAFAITQKGNQQQGWLSKNVDAIIGEGSSALIKLSTGSGAISIYK